MNLKMVKAALKLVLLALDDKSSGSAPVQQNLFNDDEIKELTEISLDADLVNVEITQALRYAKQGVKK